MSVEVMTEVWKTSKAKGNDLLLMLAGANYADEMGYCWPSIRTLAKRTRMSPRSVLRSIAFMRSRCELYVIHGGSRGNKYVILSGCSFGEAKRRLQHALAKNCDGDKVSPKGDKVSPKVFQNKHKSATDPLLNPSTKISPAQSLWEEQTRQPVPGVVEWDKFELLVEMYGAKDIIAAIAIARDRQGLGRVTVPYIGGIFAKGGPAKEKAKPKPSEPAPRRQKRLEPIVPQNYTPGPKAAAIMEEARRQLAEKQKAKAAS